MGEVGQQFFGERLYFKAFFFIIFYSCVHKKIKMDYRASPGK
jgi:hypothetical protein